MKWLMSVSERRINHVLKPQLIETMMQLL